MRYRYRIALSSIWAIPATLIVRIARPLLLIRVCGIRSDRIGHFVADVAEHIGREKTKPARTLNLFFLRGPISNTQWEQMAKRSSLKLFGNWLRYLDDWNRIIPGGASHVIGSSLTGSRDVEGLFRRFDCSIPFLTTENKECENWLESHGWSKGEPIVALLVRDSAYLSQHHSSYDWRYHSYRDSDIKCYVPAMEWLSSQGVWVFRMGKSMTNRIQSKSNRVVDYAFDSNRSDLLDIWLFANSSAIISTASGLDYLGGIYRKPILFLNCLPLSDFASYFHMTWVPKSLIWKKSQKPLTLSESLVNTYYSSQEYEKRQIEVVDLTAEMITDSVKEFWQQTFSMWPDSTEDREKQEKFWKIFVASDNFSKNHKVVHEKARVGASWLSKMGEDYLK